MTNASKRGRMGPLDYIRRLARDENKPWSTRVEAILYIESNGGTGEVRGKRQSDIARRWGIPTREFERAIARLKKEGSILVGQHSRSQAATITLVDRATGDPSNVTDDKPSKVTGDQPSKVSVINRQKCRGSTVKDDGQMSPPHYKERARVTTPKNTPKNTPRAARASTLPAHADGGVVAAQTTDDNPPIASHPPAAVEVYTDEIAKVVTPETVVALEAAIERRAQKAKQRYNGSTLSLVAVTAQILAHTDPALAASARPSVAASLIEGVAIIGTGRGSKAKPRSSDDVMLALSVLRSKLDAGVDPRQALGGAESLRVYLAQSTTDAAIGTLQMAAAKGPKLATPLTRLGSSLY